jgi:hypothetical protein
VNKNSAGNDTAPDSAHQTLDAWAWIARAREAAARVTHPAAPSPEMKKGTAPKPRRKRAADNPRSAAK